MKLQWLFLYFLIISSVKCQSYDDEEAADSFEGSGYHRTDTDGRPADLPTDDEDIVEGSGEPTKHPSTEQVEVNKVGEAGEAHNISKDGGTVVETESPKVSPVETKEAEPTKASETSDDGLSPTVIIGIVAILVLLVLILVIVIVICRKKAKKNERQTQKQQLQQDVAYYKD